MDPFETLALPRRFGLDLKLAEARHLELSKTLHPDRYVGAPPNERRLALSRAVEVNEAWRALRDPIKRAEAILRLSGLEAEVGETREPKPSGAFLMEVMEAREALEEAKASRDAARVEGVVREARAQLGDAERALARAIDPVLDQGGGAAELRAAIPLLGRLRYAARLLEEARNAEDDLM
ncbi:MAG: Fe-S protein assembly co-chaperone HscB [Deltaproteobacteria bacterium]|nr:Fe-S protein assembly co-chaperone HscB [Deltaproteobacteria bacterium]